MSVLEAMSYGLPVVVPGVGGFPKIVQNGEQGFLIQNRQKEVYAERILQLVVNPALRLKMAESSREAMAREYVSIYSEHNALRADFLTG